MPSFPSASLSTVTASPSQAEWLTAQLRSSRLTVLCAETAESMTELLTTGVMPRLQRRVGDRQGAMPREHTEQALPFRDRREKRADATEICVYIDHWGESPRHVLVERVLDAVGERGRRAAAGDGLPVRLADKLAALSQRFGLRFLIILDGFEACLAAPPERPDLRALCDELLAAINEPHLPAQFLLALHEDGEPLMQQLRQRIEGFDAVRKPLPAGPAEAREAGEAASIATRTPPTPDARPAAGRTEAVYALIEGWLSRSSRSSRSERVPTRAEALRRAPRDAEAQAPEPFEAGEPQSRNAVELPSFAQAPRRAPDLVFSTSLRETVTTQAPATERAHAQEPADALATMPNAAVELDAADTQAPAEPEQVPARIETADAHRVVDPQPAVGEPDAAQLPVMARDVEPIETPELEPQAVAAPIDHVEPVTAPLDEAAPMFADSRTAPIDAPESEPRAVAAPIDTHAAEALTAPLDETASTFDPSTAAANDAAEFEPQAVAAPIGAAEPVAAPLDEAASTLTESAAVAIDATELEPHAVVAPLDAAEPVAAPFDEAASTLTEGAAVPIDATELELQAIVAPPVATPLDAATPTFAESAAAPIEAPRESTPARSPASAQLTPSSLGAHRAASAAPQPSPVIALREPLLATAATARQRLRRDRHPFGDDDAESSLFVDTIPGPYLAEPDDELVRAPLSADFAEPAAPPAATTPDALEGLDLGGEPLRARSALREPAAEAGGRHPPPGAAAGRRAKKAAPPWRSLVAVVGAALLVAAVAGGLWWWPEHEAPLAEQRGEPDRFTPLEPALAGTAATAATPGRGRIALAAGDALAARIGDDLARAITGAGGPGIAVQASRGWYEDLAALRDGSRLAIARYDALQAARGDSGAGPLRIVMPLFTEELAFVVRADSPLRWIHQIEGKRINIGPGGGARALTVRTAYARLFNKPLASERSSLAGEAAALDELLGRSVDVVVLVGNAPAPWAGAWPEMAGGLRLLALDRNHASTQRALRAMLSARLDAGAEAGPEAPPTQTLAVMAFLVAGGGSGAGTTTTTRTGAPAAKGAVAARVGSEEAGVDLARVASALCRQLPALQRDGHPKWREVRPELQLETGWPYASEAQEALRECSSSSSRNGPASAAPTRAPQAVRPARTAALEPGENGGS